MNAQTSNDGKKLSKDDFARLRAKELAAELPGSSTQSSKQSQDETQNADTQNAAAGCFLSFDDILWCCFMDCGGRTEYLAIEDSNPGASKKYLQVLRENYRETIYKTCGLYDMGRLYGNDADIANTTKHG